MKWEYLIFNLIVFTGPLLAILFYPGVKTPRLKTGLIAIVIPAIFFILWDQLVTGYFWNFNPAYITGFYFFNLPIEEVLFFFSVPWACLFLWENIKDYTERRKKPVLLSLIILLYLIGSLVFFFKNIYYTALVLFVFGLILILGIILKTKIFRQKNSFKFIFLVILSTLVFNGYLTARPVVTYNNFLKTNINIYTVPLEDVIYGLALIFWVILIYEKLIESKSHDQAGTTQ